MTADKGKPIFEVVLPLGLPFKVTLDWRYPAPHNQRGKRPKSNTDKGNSRKEEEKKKKEGSKY